MSKKGIEMIEKNSSLHRRQTRHTTEHLLPLSLEHNLNPELLTVLIEPSPVAFIPTINLPSLQLERTSLVRLRSNDQVLVLIIGRLNLLLKSRHEANTGRNTWSDLLELQLEQQALLARQRVQDLGDFVSWPANLDQLFLDLHTRDTGQRRWVLVLAFARLARRSSCEVRLVLASLRVGEV